jgi:hypothetical protein
MTSICQLQIKLLKVREASVLARWGSKEVRGVYTNIIAYDVNHRN